MLVVVITALGVIIGMECNDLLRRLAKAQRDKPVFNPRFVILLLLYAGLPVLVLVLKAYPEFADKIIALLRPW